MKKRHFALLIPVFAISCNSGTGDGSEKSDDQKDTLIETEAGPVPVTFNASDGLEISANLYEASVEAARPIVLCHQARYNKFEYSGIAERLNELGFHCLAIDQRSGGPIANMPNETNDRAKEKGLGVDYLDAAPDITAAVDYMNKKYNQPVILWGSSYSSTLVLYEAVKNADVSSVVAFSPGDYFADTLGSLVPLLADFEKPMFLTSGSWEWEGKFVAELIAGKKLGSNQIQFVPKGDGHHGSMALWPGQEGGEEYWEAIEMWLGQLM